MRHRIFASVFVFVALTLVMAPPTQAGVSLTRVLATAKQEYSASANAGWLAYAQAPRRSGDPSAYAKPSGERAFRINEPGTFGGSTSIEIGNPILGDVVAYQQWKGANGPDNIKLYDLVSDTWLDTPDGVNTEKSEIGPSISGNYLVFARGPKAGNPTKVILHDLTDDSQQVIDEAFYAYPGDVHGDWLVWQRCERACRIMRYQISTQERSSVKTPRAGTESYSPVIDDDGTVFFLRSGPACGLNVRIYRAPVGGNLSTHYRFPDRVDGYLNEVTELNGFSHIYFSRYECRRDDWDIYRLPA